MTVITNLNLRKNKPAINIKMIILISRTIISDILNKENILTHYINVYNLESKYTEQGYQLTYRYTHGAYYSNELVVTSAGDIMK